MVVVGENSKGMGGGGGGGLWLACTDPTFGGPLPGLQVFPAAATALGRACSLMADFRSVSGTGRHSPAKLAGTGPAPRRQRVRIAAREISGRERGGRRTAARRGLWQGPSGRPGGGPTVAERTIKRYGHKKRLKIRRFFIPKTSLKTTKRPPVARRREGADPKKPQGRPQPGASPPRRLGA